MMRLIASHNGWNYWQGGADVYIAHREHPLDLIGNPIGSRWLCTMAAWPLYKKIHEIA